ncbi:Fur family transcriptional regulator [Rhodothalassium salexigens]|uniref:Fur family transcriptional regulator n=1 Tax=Rhodothalassium salexigens TaxID=1086 RepID=UPI0019129380|nr:Fur family transcriptional regulator [Rhodothalassium salexigens]MBK5912030.1 Fur family transcriptional regulator [Rhodothalassium salexigens]MBK5921212.1 Fur family transcriptional regulator [Rhodothalassium salexigens]
MDGIETDIPGAPHDHDACVSAALETAAERCRRRGSRLTPVRRQVLEIVWESHRPVKAYDVLARLSEHGRAAKPPTVYRALGFLMDQGLIHRIEGLNAFIGCARPNDAHTGYFLICERCQAVTEMASPRLETLLGQEAAGLGFTVKAQTVEIFGLCAACGGGR